MGVLKAEGRVMMEGVRLKPSAEAPSARKATTRNILLCSTRQTQVQLCCLQMRAILFPEMPGTRQLESQACMLSLQKLTLSAKLSTLHCFHFTA